MISGVIFLQCAGEREKGRGRRGEGEMERRQASNLGCRLGVGRGKECCGFRRNFSYSLPGECCVVFNRSIIILREPGRDEEPTAGEETILRRPSPLTQTLTHTRTSLLFPPCPHCLPPFAVLESESEGARNAGQGGEVYGCKEFEMIQTLPSMPSRP